MYDRSSSVAIKKGKREGKTELAKSDKPFCAACILSLEKITSKIVKIQNKIGIKLFLNLINIIFILEIAIKSPFIIY